MENNEQPTNSLEGLTEEELTVKEEELLAAIARKREGRKAMEESGMEVEPEEEDMDMQDLLTQLTEIRKALDKVRNPVRYSNQSELNLG